MPCLTTSALSISKCLDEFIAENRKGDKRNYIGASSIGNPCERAIWYDYKGFPKSYSAKLCRTFEIGHALEDMILNMLVEAGITITVPYGAKEKYHPPYFDGHCDAIVVHDDGSRSILELKTANNSSFQTFKNKGLRQWNNRYYLQVQSYMGLYDIKRAVVLAINKDTSDLHEEWVEYCPVTYDAILVTATLIHERQDPPARISESPMNYICKSCQFYKECFKQESLDNSL